MTARLFALLAILFALAGPAWSQPAPNGGGRRAEATRTLTEAQVELRQLSRAAAQTSDDDQLSDLRAKALALQARGEGVGADEQARLTQLDANLATLGPAPAAPLVEPPTVQEARARLTRGRAAHEALLRQARLQATAARQAAERIVERRRTLFNQRLFTRAASPFSAELWSNIGDNLPRDAARLRRLGEETTVGVARRADLRALSLLLGAALLAALLIGPGRLWLEAIGRRRAASNAPSGALGRSGFAVWRLAAGTLLPALAAGALHLGLSWSGLFTGEAGEVADFAARLIVWIAFVTALGRAFLSPGLPNWRLPPLSDALAKRLRFYPWLVAVVTAAGALLERINSVIGASLAATLAANCAISIAYALTAGVGLLIIGRARLRELRSEEPAAADASPVRGLLTVAVLLAVGVAFVAALLGYLALAYLIARQILWIAITYCLLYILLRFIDDAFTAVFSGESPLGRRTQRALGLRPTTVEQAGVVGSALTRVTLLVLALGVVLTPFGAGAGEVLGRFGSVATGFRIGGLTLSPLGLATGIACFLVGLWIVRAIQHWLNDRYLPKTEWDAGVRASVSTAVGYLGVIVAGAWAAASMGLALQQIALIASALSVGIGFGLQAIVSNFISGLILLVERPVKVGDWVAIGDQEGDVRRINVRATEIAMFDRSTLIVPNSEFVTKTVRNVTHGDAVGRVTLRLALALDADVEAARALFLEAYRAEPAVLADPPPSVFIDAITDTGVVIQSFSYVANPRLTYPTRSTLYFDVLKRLREADIKLAQSGATVRVNVGEAPIAAPASI